ncbi:DinB family protein [Curtobacterium sp. ZW137]|uniref:DinB family protein n=1 Tax=Curtobacterium sp. ZW137 TaxID=2485104 RepID=UPI000F4BB8E1|nr:DinB family protein [Curtobacterium sp. ZW137]ROP61208.1 DinB family protein [Curtobacterium sp. ZW137]
MATNQRLEPLLEQYDFATERLLTRLAGPSSDSGDGREVEVPPLTDDEYRWEPVEACWSVRRRTDGPGPGAVKLIGAGEWGRDGAPESPWPPPITTIAWRLDHLSETLAGRASHLGGDRTFDRTRWESRGDAAGAIEQFREAAAAWRRALLSVDESDHDRTGLSSYPYGSDAEETLPSMVWWENQEILHHGAEIALLRDLYAHRAR